MAILDILHKAESMLVKGGVLGLVEWRIHIDIAPHLSNEVTQMHVVGYGLDIALDSLYKILIDQSG